MASASRIVVLLSMTITFECGCQRDQVPNKVQTSAETAEEHRSKGLALARASNLDGAIEEFRAAVLLDAKNPQYHFDLARELTSKGNREEALVQFSEVARLKPDSALAHAELGVLKFQAWMQNNYDQKRNRLRQIDSPLKGDLEQSVLECQRSILASATTTSKDLELADQAEARRILSALHNELDNALSLSHDLTGIIEEAEHLPGSATTSVVKIDNVELVAFFPTL